MGLTLLTTYNQSGISCKISFLIGFNSSVDYYIKLSSISYKIFSKYKSGCDLISAQNWSFKIAIYSRIVSYLAMHYPLIMNVVLHSNSIETDIWQIEFLKILQNNPLFCVTIASVIASLVGPLSAKSLCRGHEPVPTVIQGLLETEPRIQLALTRYRLRTVCFISNKVLFCFVRTELV